MQNKGKLPCNRPGGASRGVHDEVGRAAEILEQHGDKIRALILFSVNDEADVDDIFQDLFLSLVRKPVPSGIEDVKGYLYRAVINDVLDATRRVKGYQARLARYSECLIYDQFEEDPETVALRVEGMDRIFELIKEQLPRHQAEAVLCRYQDGSSNWDAAKKMNVRQRTFSRYLCMGLKKLRKLLEES
ncbi:MAG: RNA polymerase sigma factor [Planctomycetota bacterium]|jgi:RNA polymerase sigma factor (sigma-70 family)